MNIIGVDVLVIFVIGLCGESHPYTIELTRFLRKSCILNEGDVDITV